MLSIGIRRYYLFTTSVSTLNCHNCNRSRTPYNIQSSKLLLNLPTLGTQINTNVFPYDQRDTEDEVDAQCLIRTP